VSVHFGTGAEVSYRHFSTSAEVSSVRSVLVQTVCTYSLVTTFNNLRPLTDDPSFSYEKLVQETWYKKLVLVSSFLGVFSHTSKLDELKHCSILYEKLGSHVIEMQCRYWLEVRFVFVYNILLFG